MEKDLSCKELDENNIQYERFTNIEPTEEEIKNIDESLLSPIHDSLRE